MKHTQYLYIMQQNFQLFSAIGKSSSSSSSSSLLYLIKKKEKRKEKKTETWYKYNVLCAGVLGDVLFFF